MMLRLYHNRIRGYRGVLKQCLQLPQGFAADHWHRSQDHCAASDSIQHPLRDCQRLAAVIWLKAAMKDRLTAFDQRLMNAYQATIPGMPRVANFSRFGIMSIGMRSCIPDR